MTNDDRIPPQHVLMELQQLADLMREDPADPVVAGALDAALRRAAALRFYPGMPHETELREVFSDFCFLARVWWKSYGALLFGPDVATDRAEMWEGVGHLLTMTWAEVEAHRLVRGVKHDLR